MTNDQIGISMRIGATLFFTLMVLCVKLTSGTIPLGQMVFFRSAIALIPLVLFLRLTDDFPGGLSTKRPFGHIRRCLLGAAAMFSSFATIRYLPIAEATIIGYVTPIFTMILARIILGEQVTSARWIGVALGFSSILTLILPQLTSIQGNEDYLIGVSLGFLTAMLTSVAMIQVRSLTKTENAGAIAFYFALTCAVFGAATLPLGWATPSLEEYALLIGAGFAGGVAHILMTLGYKYSEASKLAPFEYLSLVFAVLADLLIFNIIPGSNFYVAAAFIIASVSFVAMKDRPKGKTVRT
ncbi:DMT family transporter [Pseudovibrio brasiliensis]|uniref:DMT family transporter n=1 Tax=Pseudovibrio brasiliensis TaxID=1898042 RepID=A0ABX8AR18_9HYPH|nr:DMT family transporter [Pseudovibrio brasiliensis]QUS57545.1 DMT family transporter [Pseudovibrio brasiliensis]